MAERDAFGREIGEDPLATLRGDGRPVATTPAVVAGDPLVPPPDAADRVSRVQPPALLVRRGRRPRRGLVGIVVIAALLAVFVPLALSLVGIVSDVDDAIDSARDFQREVRRPAAPAVTGLQAGSLVSRAGFGSAITRLRNAELGQPRFLRVAPDRIDATMVTRDGRLRLVRIEPGGTQRTLSTTESGAIGGGPSIRLAAVDPRAPARLTESAASRAGLAASQVDYLVLTAVGETARWTVFFKGGRAFLADAHGRIERQIG